STLQHPHARGGLRPTDSAVVTNLDRFCRRDFQNAHRLVRSVRVGFESSTTTNPDYIDRAFHHATGDAIQRRRTSGRLQIPVHDFIDRRQRTRGVYCLPVVYRYWSTVATKHLRTRRAFWRRDRFALERLACGGVAGTIFFDLFHQLGVALVTGRELKRSLGHL